MFNRFAIAVLMILGVLSSASPLRAQESADKEFLLEVQKASANYFWEQANAKNGHIKDSNDE